MARRTPALYLLALACIPLPSCINILVHDEKAAGAAATRFAQAAFVKKDNAAYELAAREFRDKVSRQQFAEIIAKIHPQGFPTEVVATEFEPIPSKRGMVIYLHG
jgi:hypothetical protein